MDSIAIFYKDIKLNTGIKHPYEIQIRQANYLELAGRNDLRTRIQESRQEKIENRKKKIDRRPKTEDRSRESGDKI